MRNLNSKKLTTLLATTLVASSLVACGSSGSKDPRTVTIGDYQFTDVQVERVESYSRSGYVVQYSGIPQNLGNEELTWAGSVGASVGACMFAEIQDDRGRKFDTSCDIPPLLPGEVGSERHVFAQSSIMPDSQTAALYISMGNTYAPFRL